MSSKEIDIKDFAIRVERLCEFILDQLDEKTGSPEQILIQELREDAANIQFSPRLHGDISLSGLDNHIRGIFKSE